jgi:Holliday junction resolvase RusA-like endonuclease
MTEFIVFGAPATKGSTVSFLGKGGKVITKTDSTGLASWTQAVGWAARAARLTLRPRSQGVAVSASFQFVKPASAKQRAFPTVKPDADKVARALLDALTGVAYIDDAQVVWLCVSKVYGPDARTTVRVSDYPVPVVPEQQQKMSAIRRVLG